MDEVNMLKQSIRELRRNNSWLQSNYELEVKKIESVKKYLKDEIKRNTLLSQKHYQLGDVNKKDMYLLKANTYQEIYERLLDE